MCVQTKPCEGLETLLYRQLGGEPSEELKLHDIEQDAKHNALDEDVSPSIGANGASTRVEAGPKVDALIWINAHSDASLLPSTHKEEARKRGSKRASVSK